MCIPSMFLRSMCFETAGKIIMKVLSQWCFFLFYICFLSTLAFSLKACFVILGRVVSKPYPMYTSAANKGSSHSANPGKRWLRCCNAIYIRYSAILSVISSAILPKAILSSLFNMSPEREVTDKRTDAQTIAQCLRMFVIMYCRKLLCIFRVFVKL